MSGCFTSRDMTISFRAWLSGRDDFRRVLFNGTFDEGWLWYVLGVVYNFSRLRLFCTMISSGHKQRNSTINCVG